MSSVACWSDYDNDGRLDFLARGSTNGSGSGVLSQLWRNTGSGFSNVRDSAAPGLLGGAASSAAWGDYDNDGRLDFYLGGELWRNTGNRFTHVPVSGGSGGAAIA